MPHGNMAGIGIGKDFAEGFHDRCLYRLRLIIFRRLFQKLHEVGFCQAIRSARRRTARRAWILSAPSAMPRAPAGRRSARTRNPVENASPAPVREIGGFGSGYGGMK